MGWGLMWLLVADARGKRKGGKKAFSTNRFHCQRWIIALLHTHFLTFYCWHWMANFPFAECLKISQNCEIKPAGEYCKNETFWVIFQHRGCCCMPWKLWCSVKREKKWLLPEDDGLHLLGNCDHIFFWERKFLWLASVPAILPNWEAQRVRGSKRASEEGMTLSYLCRR